MTSARDHAPRTARGPSRGAPAAKAAPLPGLLGWQGRVGNQAVTAALALQREPAAAAPAPPAPGRLLRTGSQGEDVRHAQERLNAHGAAPALATDAVFGPLTRRATVAFQNGHALSPDGIVGPRTSASLDGPVDVGGSSGQNRTPPTGPQPGSVLRYDTTAYTIAPPPVGTTQPALNAQVQQKQSSQPPDLGPTVTVTGVTAGSQVEVFVWNVLVQLGQHSRWGTEVDLVTAIGRPTAATATAPARPAPVGRVTLRIDNAGNAAASLVGVGPVLPGAVFPTREAAVTALQALGIARVLDGSAPWTLPHLSKAHDALSRLPADDRSALAGVDLIREQTLSLNGRPMAGLFEHSTSLATGATTATRSESLKIADLAFSGDAQSFIGDGTSSAPASFETIVHEAGHAVETKNLRDTRFARFQAQGDLNGKIAVVNTAVGTFNAASRTAFAAARAYTRPQQQQVGGLLRAVNRVTGALQAMTSNNTAARSAALETAATRAVTGRDTARAALARTAAAHPALTDFAATIAAQNAWFTAAQDRAAAVAVVEARQADERAASAPTGTAGSRRLANFVTHVNANHVPPLTQYAADNWPAHPEEFYAEAYSLWLNDRTYLQTNAPTLVTFFDSGGHR